MSSREKHEITLFLHMETDKAVMVSDNPMRHAGRNIWLPKSQCDEVRRTTVPHPGAGNGHLAPDASLGTNITLDVPMWLIEQNDLEELVG
jgi:hypothetical protein